MSLANDTQDRQDALVEAYRPAPGVFDEMMTPDGVVRPHWRDFLAGFAAFSPEELANRQTARDRLLREDGLTYALPEDPGETHEPQPLDLIPILLSAEEWDALEKGIIQRARLLNALLGDLYGPRTVLKTGGLPLPLVFDNPHFLRPCHGILPPDGTFLQFLSVEVSRGPDGKWWVLQDRVEDWTEVGYALEGRVVTSYCFPELFGQCRAQRLAGFFQNQLETWIARAGSETPRIVLLTPGPEGEDYFGDSYLARYLGLTLVETRDLTHRAGRIFLKTLDGLKPVDLVLRRVPAAGIDPLELGSEGGPGIPGLVQAARRGQVSIYNALGAQFAETPALFAFLPILCQDLLKEDLLIPNVATWWCGEEEASDEVLETLESRIFLPSHGNVPVLPDHRTPFRGQDLDPADLEALRAAIRTDGSRIAAQEEVTLSTSPMLVDGELRPGATTLRLFVAATQNGYSVMPGGRSHTFAERSGFHSTAERAVGTQDTWVQTEGPIETISLLKKRQESVPLRRTGRDLPSRAADDLFWLGRYAERCEDLMRLLQMGFRRLTDDFDVTTDMAILEAMLLTIQGEDPADHEEEADRQTLDERLRDLMADPNNPAGLPQAIEGLLRTAGRTRDRLSLDTWSTLNHFQVSARWRGLRAGTLRNASSRVQADLLLDGIKTLAAFSGFQMENMTRAHSWRFLDMGRRLERALHLTAAFKGLLTSGALERSEGLLIAVELADSLMTYRSRYLTTPLLGPTFDLLILDESNPRSIGYQITAIADHIAGLPRDEDVPTRPEEERLILGLKTRIQLLDVAGLCRRTRRGRMPELAKLLDHIESVLPAFSDALARRYFAHLDAARPYHTAGAAGS